MKLAYCYLRWSSGAQSQGHSRKRQSAPLEALCERKGWVLDNRLRLEPDVCSAYRGRHRTVGDFKRFMDAVREGTVKPGAILIIENQDRLSREELIPALALFIELITSGITVYVVHRDREYSVAEMNRNPHLMNEVQADIIRAHGESKAKEERALAWWSDVQQAKQTGAPQPGMRPSWVRLSADRSRFELIEERAAVLRDIVRHFTDGMGGRTLARHLNDSGVPCWFRSGRWRSSALVQLARSRTLIGAYRPGKRVGTTREATGPEVSGYYPAVVAPEEFDRLQLALSRHVKGRKAGVSYGGNLWRGLAWSVRDGSPLQLRSSRAKGVRYAYLTTKAAKQEGLRGGLNVPVEPFETVVLWALCELKPADLVARKPLPDLEQLATALAERRERLAQIGAALRARGGTVATLADAAADLEQQIADLEEREEAAKARAAVQGPAPLLAAQSIIHALATLPPDEVPAARERLAARLTELLARVDVTVERRNQRRRRVHVVLRFRSGAHRGVYFDLNNRLLGERGFEPVDGSVAADDLGMLF